MDKSSTIQRMPSPKKKHGWNVKKNVKEENKPLKKKGT